PGQHGEELLDFLTRIKAPGDVEVAAAPAHGGRVLDAASGRKRKALRMVARPAQDLPERDEPVEQTGLAAAHDLRPVRYEIDAVGLLAESIVEAAIDGIAAFLVLADDSLAGEQKLRQRGEGVGND